MSRETMEQCLRILRGSAIPTVDITGGAPEMHPEFRWFVTECRALGKTVMDRCNLTILLAHDKYRDLPEFLARHRVKVVSSLPYYQKGFTDRQRGEGVFDKSIRALRTLNAVGYGMDGTGLELDLVYNPAGAFLPAPQASLEADFKRELHHLFGLRFNRLYTITNMPIARYLEYLEASGNLEEYMEKLVASFNPAAVKGVMCRNTISVSWEGNLHDCDFNQMLEIPVTTQSSRSIRDFDLEALNRRAIAVDQHCYGCTAGSGSSCGGSLV
jgi:radical SAM/Cys-rich protein